MRRRILFVLAPLHFCQRTRRVASMCSLHDGPASISSRTAKIGTNVPINADADMSSLQAHTMPNYGLPSLAAHGVALFPYSVLQHLRMQSNDRYRTCFVN